MVGKTGVNPTAMVVKNPNYEKRWRYPEFLLYFGNGRQMGVVDKKIKQECDKLDDENLQHS